MKFSAALADDSEITLTSTDGTTFTFIARSVGTGFVGDKIIFNSNINTRTQANNLASAINTNMAGKIKEITSKTLQNIGSAQSDM